MADRKIKIAHLYPEVLNLYGDRGNILCLKKRLEWRGIECEVTEVKLGDNQDFTDYDIFFIGGGQDFEQEVLLNDLKTGKGDNIRSAIEDGKVFLCICGGYQMLGAVDFHTIGGKERMIDNYAFELGEESGGSIVVGYENHSGRTYLGEGVKPLGTVLSGYGNNGEDKTEGVRYKNLFGSYSHGPILPKNPAFADHLIKEALKRRYGSDELEALPDIYETQAHDYVLDKVLRGNMSQD